MADDYEYFRTVDGRIVKRKKPAAAGGNGNKKVAKPAADKGKGDKKKSKKGNKHGIRGWLMRKSEKWRMLMEALE